MLKDHMCWLHQFHNTTDTLHGYTNSIIFKHINITSIKSIWKINLTIVAQYNNINNDSIEL